MNKLILKISKTISKILKKLNRGSVLPGRIALILNKNFHKFFKLPKNIIMITGTNGKSSIKKYIYKMFKDSNIEVGSNLIGSNLINAMITTLIENSDKNGNINKDVLVLEVDEQYLKKIVKIIKPTELIVTNISRDQPPRQESLNFIRDTIKEAITDDIHLILNADDPLVSSLALNHNGKVSYYGIENSDFSKKEIDFYDSINSLYCYKCNHKLDFKHVHYDTNGIYKCTNCDFKRNTPTYKVSYKKNILTIDNYQLDLDIKKYYIYNLAICYLIGNLYKIKQEQIIKTLKQLNTKITHLKQINEYEIITIISKNENSTSFNSSLDYLLKTKGDFSILIGFNKISRRYKDEDLSWLWDINFEKLQKINPKEIICFGKYNKHIYKRLQHANLKNIKILKKWKYLKKDLSTKKIYFLFSY